jgi:alpha-galactosidase
MVHSRKLAIVLIALTVVFGATALAVAKDGSKATRSLAPTPPMGWNSYDAYCGDVNEQEFKANADYMAKHLAKFGWKYVVVDYYWYFLHPGTEDFQKQEQLELAMDKYGRLLPAENRFPSAAGGKGFKPLADYVH